MTTRPTASVLGMLRSVADPVRARSVHAHLQHMDDWLPSGLAGVEQSLAGVLGEHASTDPAARAGRHLLARPGKRLRPLCVLVAARLTDDACAPAARDAAVAAELVHVATLLHDDVLDVGTERRGAPAAWVVTSNAAAILGGDYLLIEGLRRVASLRRPELLDLLLETIDAMVTAEALQVARRGRFDTSRDLYRRVALGKTAHLFRWCLVAGGMLAGVDRPAVQSLAQIGSDLGLAFQLVDDILDLRGDAATLGKHPLADLRDGKQTWPVLLACEQDPTLIDALRRYLDEPTLDPASLIDRIQRGGAVDATLELAHDYADRARRAALRLPDRPARGALVSLIDAAVHRRA